MNQAKLAIETMHPDIWYTPQELADCAHMPLDTAQQVLRVLERGQLVEVVGDKYKKYKTKQKRLL